MRAPQQLGADQRLQVKFLYIDKINTMLMFKDTESKLNH